MKVIIIGAKGMLGQELAKAFKAENPLLWDFDTIDITNQRMVNELISKEKPELAINAAAYNDVDGAETKQEIANKVNGFGPGFLAAAMQKIKGTLIQYSTDYVFKGDKKTGYTETDSPDPQSTYARSKYLGEQEVQKNCDRFYLIRLSRLFGQPSMSAAGKRSFVDVMLDLAKKKNKLNVVNEELSCPTYAPHLAQATRELLGKPFGVYHITNTGACTWFDFAREIFAVSKINVTLHPVPASFYPRHAVRPAYSVLINTKLPVLPTWQNALREYLKK
ncbi:MAG: dTDP-4-dehydrorhamnose reductase [Patescibacteria group bacterium]|nr:dTDP-4-dehydrorhamnose reductase [Patescibacteria group bacterium]MDD5715122.1 dTDP-4-dehydrorhamnose reductase [Patescibacteria group bacterium]